MVMNKQKSSFAALIELCSAGWVVCGGEGRRKIKAEGGAGEEEGRWGESIR